MTDHYRALVETALKLCRNSYQREDGDYVVDADDYEMLQDILVKIQIEEQAQ